MIPHVHSRLDGFSRVLQQLFLSPVHGVKVMDSETNVDPVKTAHVRFKNLVRFTPPFIVALPVDGGAPVSIEGPTTMEWTYPPRSYIPLHTKVSFLEGGFEFCYASDCNLGDGVITLSLDRLLVAPYIDENGDVDGDLLADFSKLNEPLAFTEISLDGQEEQHSGMLLMGVPYEGGGVRALTQDEYAANSSDLIRVGLEVEHLLEDSTILWWNAFKGSCWVTVGFNEVAASSELAQDGAAIKFTASAFVNNQLVTTVKVDQYQGLTSVTFGDASYYTAPNTGMFLLFPMFTEIGGKSSKVLISAKSHTTGDFAGLIVITMRFEQLQGTVSVESLLSSSDMGFSWGASTMPVLQKLLPTRAIDGRSLPTKMLMLPRGEFGMCFDPACDVSKAVKMSFTGLGSPEDPTTVLSRFARAPGFQFSQPQQVTNGNTEVWRMDFLSLVPLSRTRPPMPYTAALAAEHPSMPAFGVSVEQYFTHGSTQNGDQPISIPFGGLKFSLNVTRWPFTSPSQTLVLNVTLGNITEDEPFTGADSFSHQPNSSNMAKIGFSGDQFLQMPLLAVVDGAMQAIQIGVSADLSVGITLSLTFPAFSSSLVYDPVLASNTLAPQVDSSRTRVRGHAHSSMAISSSSAIAMLSFLCLFIAAAIISCARRTPMRKWDLSKIIP